jgi:hypothetical protein
MIINKKEGDKMITIIDTKKITKFAPKSSKVSQYVLKHNIFHFIHAGVRLSAGVQT